MNKKVITIIFITVFALLALLVIINLNVIGDVSNQGDFEKTPDLEFTDYSGQKVALADFEGMLLVVNSWAVWCPFCVEELKDFAAAQKEFGSEVTIIAINRAEPLQTAKGFTDEAGITNDMVFLMDSKDSFYKAIGGFSMPETIFVNKEGNIIERKRGPMDLAEIRQRINNLISQN